MNVLSNDSGDDVQIWVGTQKIAGWETVEVTRSAELFPNHFRVTLTEVYPSDPTRILIKPGQPCQVYIGETLAVTGFVDQYTGRISAQAHDVEIVGRGKCEDLVDCSADLLSPDSPVVGGSASAASLLDLATQLCKPFGIKVLCNVADLGGSIRTFQVALGDTPYEVIERVASYAGYLIYENERGDLVLDRIGTQKMASGFAQGVNVETAAATYSANQRFTDITVVFSTVDQLTEGANTNLWNRRATRQDTQLAALPRYRPRIVATMQTDQSPDYAERMAQWELARRYGRSQAVNLTCDSWRDSAGRLWQPNWLVTVDLPALKLVKVQWIIATVTFRKDDSGTHADLLLMPPEAFSVQPEPLNVFDWEINSGRPTSQTPAPATTTPPASQTGAGGLQGHA